MTLGVGISPDLAKFGVAPRMVQVQEPKFKIPLPRSFVSQPIEYKCQVSSTSSSAQQSRSLRLLKMLTPHGQTDIRLVLQVISEQTTKNTANAFVLFQLATGHV